MTKEERKAKVAAKKAKRDASDSFVSESVAQNVQNQIDNTKAGFEDNAMPKPAFISQYAPARITDSLEVSNPIGTRQAEVQNPKGIAQEKKIEKLNPIVGKAEVQNPTGLAGQPKPKTLSDYLAEQREKIRQEKTTAEKMQRYYALTDALGALGKMGGAMIGGAIGGNMMDSVPNVGEYKESRGYLDAIEKAKQANDRLRALDDKEFQLALRDDERNYNQQIAKAERDFRRQMIELENQLAEARANKDFERQNQLIEKKAKLTLEHDTKLANINNKHGAEMKKLSVEMVKMQNGLGEYAKDKQGESIPVMFSDNSTMEIPERLYNGLANYLIGTKIGDQYIDEENVAQAIKNNPFIAKSYLAGFGLGEAPTMSPKPVEDPEEKRKRELKERKKAIRKEKDKGKELRNPNMLGFMSSAYDGAIPPSMFFQKTQDQKNIDNTKEDNNEIIEDEALKIPGVTLF